MSLPLVGQFNSFFFIQWLCWWLWCTLPSIVSSVLSLFSYLPLLPHPIDKKKYSVPFPPQHSAFYFPVKKRRRHFLISLLLLTTVMTTFKAKKKYLWNIKQISTCRICIHFSVNKIPVYLKMQQVNTVSEVFGT